jgi:hypothetical protein
MSAKKGIYASPEQLRYATMLDWGMKIGLGILAIGFLAYVFGLVPAQVPLQDIPHYWKLPVEQYLQQTGKPSGWGWVRMLGRGDTLPIAGIAILSGVSALCVFFALIPAYAKNRDKAYLAIAIFQMLVLVLAASGILTAHQ